MDTSLEKLRRQRVPVFLLCIGYFLLLLATGTLFFLKNADYGIYLVALCLVLYLLVVRPRLSRYRQQLRRAMLEGSLGKTLSDMTYAPDKGISAETLAQSGLFPMTASYLSKERIQGTCADFQVMLADVTFPIRNGNRNEMFSGCAVVLKAPEHSFRPLRVEASQVVSGTPDGEQQALLEELSHWIPGNLYLNACEDGMFVLLRGRFLGFKVNALMDVTEKTLSVEPLPEWQQIQKLGQTLCQ